MKTRLPLYMIKIRGPLIAAGVLLMITTRWHGIDWLVGFILWAIGAVAMLLPVGYLLRAGGAPATDPREVRSPVLGDWVPVNSPADKVPSHGVHMYGQTHAIDLLHAPLDGRPWKAVHSWPPARRPAKFPSFGRPIFAPADGIVVRVRERERDHWSRNSWPGLLYLFVIEGFFRELGGPNRILGNHVILDLGDGTYAALAHLRRGSVLVKKGQRVTAGEQIAECGNSGNSSEPHLHFQLMDHPNVPVAAGLPFAFDHYEIDGETRAGVPGGQKVFTVAGTARSRTS